MSDAAAPGEPGASELRAVQGRSIALTRPAGLNEDSARILELAGVHARTYPLLRLEALPGVLPTQAASAHGFIFISPSAVAFAWPYLLPCGLPLPAQQLAAVGGGTAAALMARGAHRVLHPPGSGDSTALLRCLPDVAGQRWVLVRGEGGREVLASGLAAQGAEIIDWPVYCRRSDAQQLQTLLQELDTLDALLLSSSEVVRTLFAHAGESLLQRLQSKPLVVLHPRIAAAARALGAHRIAVCEDMRDLPAALARVLDDRCP